MTLNEYINNPFPGGVISSQTREMTKAAYRDKFDKVMLREAGTQFPVKFYKGKSSWYIHLKVPSEAIPNFTYDVVFEFEQVKNALKLEEQPVRFYSNDPAFVFTYANTFKSHNMFCTDLASKMSKKALSIKAHEKNPANIVGYVKSIYFAYLMCKKFNYLNRTLFESRARGYSKKDLQADIMDADLKIAQRQTAQDEVNKQKRVEKSRNEIHNKNSMAQVLNPEVQTGLKRSKTMNTTRTTKVIKPKSSGIKKTKRI